MIKKIVVIQFCNTILKKFNNSKINVLSRRTDYITDKFQVN